MRIICGDFCVEALDGDISAREKGKHERKKTTEVDGWGGCTWSQTKGEEHGMNVGEGRGRGGKIATRIFGPIRSGEVEVALSPEDVMDWRFACASYFVKQSSLVASA